MAVEGFFKTPVPG